MRIHDSVAKYSVTVKSIVTDATLTHTPDLPVQMETRISWQNRITFFRTSQDESMRNTFNQTTTESS